MTLKLYNTRTRTKDDFQPLDPANVRMYVCGPTVYDYAHIGNARPVIVFDVLYRLLRHVYGVDHVTYARNVTDVDDKINARAAELYPDLPPEAAIRKLTAETTVQFHRDVAALGCLPPTYEPRATEYIAQMRTMIETLVEKGCAYIAEDHALFNVSAMPDYGQLARRSLDEMRAGARIEVAPYKRDPMDFVLWKPSKAGEPSWPSPHGIHAPGRPGWHLECSAMAEALLGATFDIHGGGIDLVFPHHENEVAQSRCAHGTDIMANVWMHNGHLQVEGAKMAKSEGNFVTIRNIIEGWGDFRWAGDDIRFAMLSTHYAKPIDWTVQKLEQAATFLSTAKTFVWPDSNAAKPTLAFVNALSDDLNTPQAVAILYELLEQAKTQGLAKAIFPGEPIPLVNEEEFVPRKELAANLALLGIDLNHYQSPPHVSEDRVDKQQIGLAIDARLAARKAKNWAEADRIRDELAAMGIALKDAKDPDTGEIATTWKIAR